MRFAPEYVTYVLNENFEDAKELFLTPLIALHYAHLVMLAERGIVSATDAHTLRQALDTISQDAVRRVQYDGTYEDLFFYVDRLVVEACGEEVAGRLHTARSRNDIDMTTYRMRQRECVLGLLAATLELRRALLDVVDRHRDTVLALHTHTQRAQPSTVAHYLLAVVEQLERDAARLKAAYERTNRNPLGACAITGTGFPIDRQLTSDLLGFLGPTVNTYGSIATVDYLLESTSAATVLLVGHGRFIQDLLLWSTSEFGYVRFGDGFVQGSSIMPQKRNPVAIEHARAIGSKALGQAQAIVIAVHNTPFGDIVDTEDDLQPLVFAMFRDATRAVKLVAAAMPTADFDASRLEARAGDGWTTLTELADTLVREHGLAFGAAHAIAARLVAVRQQDPTRPLADLLTTASGELLGTPIVYAEEALAHVLSARHFVEIRRTLGGPAPEETARAAAVSRRQLEADEAWWKGATDALGQAGRTLAARSAAL
ncbi:MAG: argininosuccinate lyase [Acidobacteria bacterium RIFCSPLOWO2_12_FULL_66_10]|nr:MAG: argininosuccinate lyase [Acidobacteria bacterium RIFCSPLOWO2_12_FULL_66_10]